MKLSLIGDTSCCRFALLMDCLYGVNPLCQKECSGCKLPKLHNELNNQNTKIEISLTRDIGLINELIIG